MALALIVLPWLRLADAQQQHSPQPIRHHVRSPAEDDRHGSAELASTPLAALTGQQVIETPSINARRKNTVASGVDNDAPHLLQQQNTRPKNVWLSDDASAASLAPELSVRAAPPSYRPNRNGVGLSQHLARNLDDWEVEDYVLLATVDGDLYASDRITGNERWHYKASQPMIETTHFRANRSELEDDYDERDRWIWVVEPTRDGELYIWRPHDGGVGLTKLGWTMKKLVEELSPKNDAGVVYNGEKRTTTVVLNAATGKVLKEFGTAGTYINKMAAESCQKPNGIAEAGDEECGDGGTITIGRTEYVVVIHRKTTSEPIAQLKYSEWTPNTVDNDLIQQNHASKDNRYVSGQHDGQYYGFDYARLEERPLFTKKLSSPIARVFDVLQRCMTPGADPELIVLPQPPIPARDQDSLRRRSENVFINQTSAGSWYALSGVRYPLIVHAKPAPINTWDQRDIQNIGVNIDESLMSKAMVGTYHISRGSQMLDPRPPRQVLGIEGGSNVDVTEPEEEESSVPSLIPPPPPEGVIDVAKRFPEFAFTSVIDFVRNPVAAVLVLLLFWRLYKERILRFGNTPKTWDAGIISPQLEITSTVPTTGTTVKDPAVPDKTLAEDKVEAPKTEETAPVAVEDPETVIAPPQVPQEEAASVATSAAAQALAPVPKPVEANEVAAINPNAPAPDAKPKKKAHRGHRGGAKHKKGAVNKGKREGSQSRDDDPVQTVEEVVNKAKQLGEQPKLEPDIITVPNGVEEVSGPILKMGSLEVNEEQQLGTGSNGTVVFAGKWDGRDVAVKRMLVQFNEIASQETRLLRESDDHPNGRICLVHVTDDNS